MCLRRITSEDNAATTFFISVKQYKPAERTVIENN